MAVGILCILLGLVLMAVGKIAEGANTPFPPIEDQDEFWEYHVKLSGITDPRERRRFEAEKKRELLERQRAKQK